MQKYNKNQILLSIFLAYLFQLLANYFLFYLATLVSLIIGFAIDSTILIIKKVFIKFLEQFL